MTRTRLATTAALMATLMLSGAAPALGSDAGLRRIVIRHEHRLAPLVRSFRRADGAFRGKAGAGQAFAAAGRVRGGLHRYKVAVVPIGTGSSSSAAGKRLLLRAIREFDLGLVQYQRLAFKVKANAPFSSIKSSYLRLNRRIRAAAGHEARALRLL